MGGHILKGGHQDRGTKWQDGVQENYHVRIRREELNSARSRRRQQQWYEGQRSAPKRVSNCSLLEKEGGREAREGDCGSTGHKD